MFLNIRKPKLKIHVGVSVFFVLILLTNVAIVALYRPKPAEPDTTSWQTGDIFFSVGDSWESVAVRSITGIKNVALSDSTPSHCGIVMINERGLLLVHESTAKGCIVAETPAEYIEINGSYCIYAKSSPFRIDTLRLKADIDSMLRKTVPFDYNFNHRDGKSLYCTEMVVTLHELNGCNSLSRLRDKHYIYPQDILNQLKVMTRFNYSRRKK